MKKYLSLCLATIFFLGLVSSPGYTQTAKDIMEKMIEAQGGRKLLETVKDTTLTGAMEMIQYGMKGIMTMYQKEPNKMRMDMEIMGMIISQGYDGQTAWMTNPQTGVTQEMPERFARDMRRQAMGTDATLNPEKYGISYEFKGKEKIEDKECLVLEQTYSDGYKATLYVDPTTYLLYKTKGKSLDQTGVEVEAETVFGDYQKDNEMMTPHSITIYQNASEFIRMTVTKVTINSGLEDSLFQMTK